jgi:autotransporter-associated beta strand protein
MGMSATFRMGIAADSVGSGQYAPDYMSIYNSGTGSVFSSALTRNGSADMAFFDIDAAAGDTFTAAMWQRTDSGPGASVAPFSLITFDVSQYKFDVAGGNSTSTNSNVISGAAAGISKTGNGTQILSGNNTYAGNTTVSAGRLAVDNGNALGSTAAGTTVASGAQLYLNGVTVGNESLTISGTGLSDNTTSFFAGAIRSANGTSNTLQGKVNLAADARIFTGTSTSLTVDVASGDAINLGAFNLNIDGAGTHTVNDAIVGTGGLVKTGSGITTLSGTNTYTGTTTVSAGTLAVNGSIAGEMTVASIATLQGNGTISGATTVSGNLKPGNSPGLLTFANSLTLDSTAVTTMEITGTARGTEYDAVNVGGALTYGGTLILDFSGDLYTEGIYSFDLFDFGTSGGSFESMSLAGIYSGSFTNNVGIWGLTDGDNNWSFNQGDGVLTFTVIPEPNVAMVAGSLVLMAMLRRRRD